MVIKTFNVDGFLYKEFSRHCKSNGISMSKKVENFIKEEVMKIKGRKSDNLDKVGDFSLELEKDPRARPSMPSPEPRSSEHSMGKFC